jgi:surfeit locus 1 family protein
MRPFLMLQWSLQRQLRSATRRQASRLNEAEFPGQQDAEKQQNGQTNTYGQGARHVAGLGFAASTILHHEVKGGGQAAQDSDKSECNEIRHNHDYPPMKESARSARFWVVTAAALLMAALSFSLGQWQLDRAEQKQARQASLEQKKALPPLTQADLLAAETDSGEPVQPFMEADRLIDLSGRWQPEHTVYLDNRPMNAKPGFWVLTPLRLTGSDKAVLVQRGWIARNFQDRTALASIETPEQTVTLRGRMAPAPAKLYAFKGEDTGRIRQNLDIPDFAAETGLPLLSVLVIQVDANSEGLQRDWAAPNIGVDKHHGYAFQWFGLCALVLGLYVWFQLILPRRQRRSASRFNNKV